MSCGCAIIELSPQGGGAAQGLAGLSTQSNGVVPHQLLSINLVTISFSVNYLIDLISE